jgi:excisionase family DNA binding protein
MDNRMKEIPKVEIKDKLNLTIREAAIYSNIGINKIEDMVRQPNCPFVLYIGRKKLIKRNEFEKYLEKVIEL